MFLDSIVVIYLNQTYNLISGRVNSIICSSGRRFNTLEQIECGQCAGQTASCCRN